MIISFKEISISLVMLHVLKFVKIVLRKKSVIEKCHDKIGY